ncbi:glycosyltransferase family 8 protein [Diplodia corticola]|uniref:Glycosyltransferase family 8 protein n=1 Tax=Diplodia corticola TaxID=236234 RepID=A0A1J9QXZ9_9PEZI|nr:glycosyltransferase family 8 protein [Diplodia corticola]OJD33249.1 glycosyltransferase family 8 protein [Diplodia corticola]
MLGIQQDRWRRPTGHYWIAAFFLSIFLVAIALYYSATDQPPNAVGGNNRPSRQIYATYLTAPSADQSVTSQPHGFGDDDPYFVGVRLLNYQLRHAPETRTRRGLPFVVFVTPAVEHAKRSVLLAEGADVVEIAHLGADWIHPPQQRWADVLTKLRMWEFEDAYDRVAFLDSDMLLTAPLDGLFDEPAAAAPRRTLDRPNATLPDEAPLPGSYVMAGVPQADLLQWPSFARTPNYAQMNAGLMVFKPSRALFAHYESVLRIPGRFDPTLPEQFLLNYVHRADRSMPWSALDLSWQAQYPNAEDIASGVRVLHDKWWNPWIKNDTAELFHAWRWRMEGFYEGLRGEVYEPAYYRHEGTTEG